MQSLGGIRKLYQIRILIDKLGPVLGLKYIIERQEISAILPFYFLVTILV